MKFIIITVGFSLFKRHFQYLETLPVFALSVIQKYLYKNTAFISSALPHMWKGVPLNGLKNLRPRNVCPQRFVLNHS